MRHLALISWPFSYCSDAFLEEKWGYSSIRSMDWMAWSSWLSALKASARLVKYFIKGFGLVSVKVSLPLLSDSSELPACTSCSWKTPYLYLLKVTLIIEFFSLSWYWINKFDPGISHIFIPRTILLSLVFLANSRRSFVGKWATVSIHIIINLLKRRFIAATHVL